MVTVDEQVGASTDDGTQYGSTMDITNSLVYIEFTDYLAACRFTGINIPSGATITVAYMEIYLPYAADDFFTGKVLWCENNNNPPTLTTDDNNLSDRTKTSNSVALGEGQQGTGWKTLPSMVALIQEVVDDQGGTGDALVAILTSTTGDDLYFRSYDYSDGSLAAKIHIEYTVGAEGRSRGFIIG